MRIVLLVAIAVLYVVSIPWYRESGATPSLWFGLPEWVAVAVACYVGAAVLNAVAWLLTDIPDADPDPRDDATADEDTGDTGERRE